MTEIIRIWVLFASLGFIVGMALCAISVIFFVISKRHLVPKFLYYFTIDCWLVGGSFVIMSIIADLASRPLIFGAGILLLIMGLAAKYANTRLADYWQSFGK